MIAACQVAEWRATSQGSPSGGRMSAGRARVAGEVNAPGDPADHDHGEDRPDRRRVRGDVGGDGEAHGSLDHRAPAGHDPSVDPVGHGSGDQHQEQDGQELGQADEAEVQLPARQVEDQHAQGGQPRQVGRRAQERRPDQRPDRRPPVARHPAPHLKLRRLVTVGVTNRRSFVRLAGVTGRSGLRRPRASRPPSRRPSWPVRPRSWRRRGGGPRRSPPPGGRRGRGRPAASRAW